MARPQRTIIAYDAAKMPQAAAGLARQGYKPGGICKALGITLATYKRWCEIHEDFAAATQESAIFADATVENALYRRAIGYDYVEIKRVKDEHGKVIREEQAKKHVSPDTSAAITWLTNRQRDRWKNRTALEHTGPGDGPMIVSTFADLARRALLDMDVPALTHQQDQVIEAEEEDDPPRDE